MRRPTNSELDVQLRISGSAHALELSKPLWAIVAQRGFDSSSARADPLIQSWTYSSELVAGDRRSLLFRFAGLFLKSTFVIRSACVLLLAAINLGASHDLESTSAQVRHPRGRRRPKTAWSTKSENTPLGFEPALLWFRRPTPYPLRHRSKI